MLHTGAHRAQEAYMLHTGAQEAHILHTGAQEAHILHTGAQEAHILHTGAQEAYILHTGAQEAYILHTGAQEVLILCFLSAELCCSVKGHGELPGHGSMSVDIVCSFCTCCPNVHVWSVSGSTLYHLVQVVCVYACAGVCMCASFTNQQHLFRSKSYCMDAASISMKY